MTDSVVVIFKNVEKNINVGLDAPLFSTVRGLVIGLNESYELDIDINDIKKCYLKVDNPVMLLRGNMLLRDAGIRNGSVISYSW